jgi:hypothetical protein
MWENRRRLRRPHPSTQQLAKVCNFEQTEVERSSQNATLERLFYENA